MRENENEMAADAATPLTDAELEQVTGGAGSLTSLITTERRFIETFRFESSALSSIGSIRSAPVGLGCPRGHQTQGPERPSPQAATDRALLATVISSRSSVLGASAGEA